MTTTTVTVYTSAGCEPCDLVKVALAGAGIEFRERSVSEPGVWEEADQYLPMDVRSVPVTVVAAAGTESVLLGWSAGFPDLVRSAVASAGGAPVPPGQVRDELQQEES